ncbi:MAG: 3-hydroxyacyl-CoA dehydrogenase NAD-binding domain-containing protein [Acidimicrobiaceae bacterium]|nr:3-hydroxyacyl-CoA dehydrogenase NAD-binding domain-containing protein [Acidimicrobiaceae bacterium]
MATDMARTIGLAGTGVIGSGWAARALARGHDVIAWDPADGAEERLRAAIVRAWPSATRLGLFPGADPDRQRDDCLLAVMRALRPGLQPQSTRRRRRSLRSTRWCATIPASSKSRSTP